MPKEKLPQASPDQRRAWEFYGVPVPPTRDGRPATTSKALSADNKVGEVRYIIGWIADQMVRMGWRVRINGSEKWNVTLPDGAGVIASVPDTKGDVQTDPKHPANASAELLKAIMWNTRTVREVTTNLFVAGELHYALDGAKWRVVSVVRSDREEIIERSTISVRGLWPHPADPDAPDAPLFGVLGVLDDMLWLNRLSRQQSANRVGMRGILAVADSWRLPGAQDGDDDAFWRHLEDALSRPMNDPEDVSPVGLVGPKELVESSGNGMKGLTWTIPNFPYDGKVDARMEKLVQRLAYGLPIPPEILLGLQAQSKATAFQVEGSTYRAHIEPVALLVADIATDALKLFLPDEIGEVEVLPDPTTILARRHSVSDVLEAYDRGAASQKYLREVLGIPESAAPSAQEIAAAGAGPRSDAPEDPANIAADEPISAAAQMPSDRGEKARRANDDREAEFVSDILHRIDSAALHELIGAAGQGVFKARERVGAYMRSQPKIRERIPAGVANEDILTELGAEACLTALGQKGEMLIESAIESTLSWWRGRVAKARGQVEEVLGEMGSSLTFGPQALDRSVTELRTILRAAVLAGGSIAEGELRQVLDLAGDA